VYLIRVENEAFPGSVAVDLLYSCRCAGTRFQGVAVGSGYCALQGVGVAYAADGLVPSEWEGEPGGRWRACWSASSTVHVRSGMWRLGASTFA